MPKRNKFPVGRKITGVRRLTDEEMGAGMWNHRGVVVSLDDGSILYAMSDDEGNDAGVIVAQKADGTSLHLGD